MITANEQIACPECSYGWNDHTRGFHYTYCSKVAHLNRSSNQSPAPRVGEGEQWRVFEHYRKRVLNEKGVLIAEAQTEEEAARIVTEHNQYSTLVAQRDRLLHALKRMLDVFTPYASPDTEQWREEVEAYDEAQAMLTTTKREG